MVAIWYHSFNLALWGLCENLTSGLLASVPISLRQLQLAKCYKV